MNAQQKLKLLVFVKCYLPGFRGGGPIRTIANMAERFGDQIDFRIITMNRDLYDRAPYSSITVGAWNQVGRARVFYLGPGIKALSKLAKIMRTTPHDVLYMNSFFNPLLAFFPLLLRRLGLVPRVPIVMAPRGEFSDGALAIKSWKKKPYIAIVKRLKLLDTAVWQAATAYELTDIKTVYPKSDNHIKIARDPLAPAEPLVRPPIRFLAANDPRGEGKLLRICFLSRIVPMKNLDFALRVLALVKSRIDFHIYGPQEDRGYWQLCEGMIARLPKNVSARYCGSVEHENVRAVISEYDLFFVPSKGESFGHVFIEALSAGVPILVSDRTPWRGLAERSVGWDLSLERAAEFTRVLDEAAGFDAAKWRQMKAQCSHFASVQADDKQAIRANLDLFYYAASLL